MLKVNEKPDLSVGSATRLGDLAGLPFGVFIAAAAVIIIGVYMGVIPKDLIGSFAMALVFGALLEKAGDNLPFFKDYLGGGPIAVIFGMAALVYFNVLPKATVEIIKNFTQTFNFVDFYIAALITGSICGMNSKMLVKAGARYAVPILGGVIISGVFAGIAGAITGYGWKEGIANLVIPIMGGGIGAGAIPISQIYSKFMSIDSKTLLSTLLPAVAMGNMFAIIVAGLLDKLGKARPNLTGNGQLMVGVELEKDEEDVPSIKLMGGGLTLACAFFIFGKIISKFVPSIHAYAFMIVCVAIVKISGILPKQVEKGASQWYKFAAKNFTMPLLVGVGVTYTDLNAVISAISVQYVVLVAAVILGAVVGAGFAGKLVGMYPIEAAITAGLCMANMGGTGDVAVLSGAKRMELMPFAAISSRLGGSLMLLIASLVIPILF